MTRPENLLHAVETVATDSLPFDGLVDGDDDDLGDARGDDDAGGESPLHYAGDLSSTFPVDAAFSERQRTIYELSLQAHEAALAALPKG